MKLILIFSSILIFSGAFILAFFIWANRDSQNLALGYAALIGAIGLLVIQVVLQLTPSVKYDFINVEYTVDRLMPEIRQWTYPMENGGRIHAEVEASKWLSENKPENFENNREKIEQ